MSKESLYIVWCPTAGAPTVKHATVDDARAEARRLAELNPMQEFIVLRAVESVKYQADPFMHKNYSRSS